MHYAHGMEIVDCIQDLPDESAGVHLSVEALLYDAIKQFPSGYPGSTDGIPSQPVINLHMLICLESISARHVVVVLLKTMTRAPFS